jgi:clan AA aspartic protease
MILGTVNPDRREAYIRLFVHSPSGAIHEIEAVVDTGYTEELLLPSDLIAALGLPFLRKGEMGLSDGSLIQCDIHEAAVFWDGQLRPVEVQSGEGSPLVGMSLLLEHLLTVPVTAGGVLRIEPLP